MVLTGLNVTLNEEVFKGRTSHCSGETENIPLVSARQCKLSEAEITWGKHQILSRTLKIFLGLNGAMGQTTFCQTRQNTDAILTFHPHACDFPLCMICNVDCLHTNKESNYC